MPYPHLQKVNDLLHCRPYSIDKGGDSPVVNDDGLEFPDSLSAPPTATASLFLDFDAPFLQVLRLRMLLMKPFDSSFALGTSSEIEPRLELAGKPPACVS